MTIDFKDLPKVLRACRDARVFRLKAGNLEIEFTSDAVINQVKVNGLLQALCFGSIKGYSC